MATSVEDMYDLTHMGCGDIRIHSLLRMQDLSGVVPNFQMIKTLQAPRVFDNGCTLLIPHSYFVDGDEIYLPAIEIFNQMNEGAFGKIYKGRRTLYIQDDSDTDGNARLTQASESHEICIKSVSIGLYGKEARAAHDTRSEYLNESIQYSIHEAFIHSLIQNALSRAGFPNVVPTMYEILALTHTGTVQKLINSVDVKEIWMTMDVLDGVTFDRYLRKKFTRLPIKHKRGLHQLVKQKENEQILLDVCFQLACYLHILQEKLRFNHRDMKIDNVFWRYHTHKEDWKRNIFVPGVGTWKCKNDFVLIDFGFGCLACGSSCSDPLSTLLSASSSFGSSPSTICMKYGRDIAQFLYCIHAHYPLRQYISQELFEILDKSMQVSETDNFGKIVHVHKLLGGVEINGRPSPMRKYELPPKVQFSEGVYTLLSRRDIDVPGCRPSTFLQTLATYAGRYRDSFVPDTNHMSCVSSCIPS
jgi:serine/threonine protein kinase